MECIQVCQKPILGPPPACGVIEQVYGYPKVMTIRALGCH